MHGWVQVKRRRAVALMSLTTCSGKKIHPCSVEVVGVVGLEVRMHRPTVSTKTGGLCRPQTLSQVQLTIPSRNTRVRQQHLLCVTALHGCSGCLLLVLLLGSLRAGLPLNWCTPKQRSQKHTCTKTHMYYSMPTTAWCSHDKTNRHFYIPSSTPPPPPRLSPLPCSLKGGGVPPRSHLPRRLCCPTCACWTHAASRHWDSWDHHQPPQPPVGLS